MSATETQQNLSRAMKEIEEQLAVGGRKQISGLQKLQMAVKFLDMVQDQGKFDYLNSYQTHRELNLDIRLSASLEKHLKKKDWIQRKREEDERRGQARQLSY